MQDTDEQRQRGPAYSLLLPSILPFCFSPCFSYNKGTLTSYLRVIHVSTSVMQRDSETQYASFVSLFYDIISFLFSVPSSGSLNS